MCNCTCTCACNKELKELIVVPSVKHRVFNIELGKDSKIIIDLASTDLEDTVIDLIEDLTKQGRM